MCAIACWNMGACNAMSQSASTRTCKLHTGADLEGTLLQDPEWVYFPWRGFEESDYYNYYDEMMTAACTAMNSAGGLTFAPRANSGTNCGNMCTTWGQADAELAGYSTFHCVGWLSVNINATRLSATYQQDTYLTGLGTHRSVDCGQLTNAVNAQSYCCCRAS
ncbi:uncharacterized protein LOC106163850 [Lingula anatina]|uniref:Uncharacterized protein LOC106163850 n=1 Tax=Lingula anatina TaxID=7574 RepID=A0A1S3IGK9_LINAN|nr:uncharacterized protein LOC106163850 [Lingula anatina]|eukprot:XP_013397001.1 uncharacterized protein LOC106163850 [Lingula anatina]